jgi:hypothetical protein
MLEHRFFNKLLVGLFAHCSGKCSGWTMRDGQEIGRDRDRTGDPLLANSQIGLGRGEGE